MRRGAGSPSPSPTTSLRTGERAQGAWVKVFSAGACPAENDWKFLLCPGGQSNRKNRRFFLALFLPPLGGGWGNLWFSLAPFPFLPPEAEEAGKPVVFLGPFFLFPSRQRREGK